MNVEQTRIKMLKDYLVNLLNVLSYQVNVDFLDDNIDSYSLDKIPTASLVFKDVCGNKTKQDTFSFRSRKAYSQDEINNLENIGFYEQLEKLIEEKNENEELPNIEGIESIECLSPATIIDSNTNSCEFEMQIRIQYREV